MDNLSGKALAGLILFGVAGLFALGIVFGAYFTVKQTQMASPGSANYTPSPALASI